ncbi:UNVERIFIED_CONTAM: hypothetical protein GTU68_017795 [Idotea baltica]|nr:hypothetical protein [Idotea baltica]
MWWIYQSRPSFLPFSERLRRMQLSMPPPIQLWIRRKLNRISPLPSMEHLSGRWRNGQPSKISRLCISRLITFLTVPERRLGCLMTCLLLWVFTGKAKLAARL